MLFFPIMVLLALVWAGGATWAFGVATRDIGIERLAFVLTMTGAGPLGILFAHLVFRRK